jgi:hypothetical protein
VGIIEKRGASQQHLISGTIESIKKYDVGESVNILKAFSKQQKNLDLRMAVVCEAGLKRALSFCTVGCMYDPNGNHGR